MSKQKWLVDLKDAGALKHLHVHIGVGTCVYIHTHTHTHPRIALEHLSMYTLHEGLFVQVTTKV